MFADLEGNGKQFSMERKSMELSLFFIRADTEHGDNVDLLVWASDDSEADKCWRDYFKEWDLPDTAQFIKPVPLNGPAEVISIDLLRTSDSHETNDDRKMNLYWVYLERKSRVAVHLMVRALNEEHATSIWRSYLKMSSLIKPSCVRPIPMHGHIGAINWGILNT